MKRRFIQINGELIEVSQTYEAPPKGPFVLGDIPAYESPATGKIIEGRKQRRDDFARSGCRPWEGIEQEKKEAAKKAAEQAAKLENKLDESVWTAWHSLPPSKRRQLMR